MGRIRVAVIGGGASGMMAAVSAAVCGAETDLYEKNDRVGKKLLATGNGKCNFSNRKADENCYFGSDPRKREKVLTDFDTERTVAFFEKAGMLVKDKNGYLYPRSEQASTVLDILRMQLAEHNVRIFTESPVLSVERIHNGGTGFLVKTAQSQRKYDRVIVTCGGAAAPKTGSNGDGYRLAKKLGHSVAPTVPALVQLKCREPGLKAVAGVREEALLTLYADGKKLASESGELQLTEYGISGIVTFQLSRTAAYALREKKRVTVTVDSLPQTEDTAYEEFVKQRIAWAGRTGKTVEECFTGMLNKKLMGFFCKTADVKLTNMVNEEEPWKLRKVFTLCRRWTLAVQEPNSFENAQVTAGGVPLTEVTEHLESVKVPGLYFAGEVLDVDGKCGGYNLQWAWASGYTAGCYAAGRTEDIQE